MKGLFSAQQIKEKGKEDRNLIGKAIWDKH